MSLIVLLLIIFATVIVSNAMDAFPGVLWGWIYWPQWTLWISLLAIFAWCIEEEEGTD